MARLNYVATTYGYLWECPLPEAIRRLGADGFTATEIMTAVPHFSPLLATPAEIRDLKAAASSAGVKLLSLNPPGQDLNLSSPDESIRELAVRSYKRLIDHCVELEAPILVVVPGKRHPLYPSPWEAAYDPARRSLEALVRYARGMGVRLAVENVPSVFLDRSDRLQSFVSEFDPSEVGVALDVANAYMVEDPVAAISTLADRAFIVHVSDTTREKWAHNPIGEGTVPWEPVALALEIYLPRTPCVLEIIAPNAGAHLRTSRSRLEAILPGREALP